MCIESRRYMDVNTVNIYACRDATITSRINKKTEPYIITRPTTIAYDSASTTMSDTDRYENIVKQSNKICPATILANRRRARLAILIVYDNVSITSKNGVKTDGIFGGMNRTKNPDLFSFSPMNRIANHETIDR
jgi:hypothetical protein